MEYILHYGVYIPSGLRQPPASKPTRRIKTEHINVVSFLSEETGINTEVREPAAKGIQKKSSVHQMD